MLVILFRKYRKSEQFIWLSICLSYPPFAVLHNWTRFAMPFASRNHQLHHQDQFSFKVFFLAAVLPGVASRRTSLLFPVKTVFIYNWPPRTKRALQLEDQFNWINCFILNGFGSCKMPIGNQKCTSSKMAIDSAEFGVFSLVAAGNAQFFRSQQECSSRECLNTRQLSLIKNCFSFSTLINWWTITGNRITSASEAVESGCA